MAVVFSEHYDGARYEVRSAGRSLRLYVDGVLHTQFNSASPISGDVWDLLVVPALAVPPGRVRRVLMLGLGGGAAIHFLRRSLRPPTIVAVEQSAMHVRLARDYFDIDGSDLSVHRADAVAWAEGYRGAPFDVVIDDLFGEDGGEPQRAVAADRRWTETLIRLLEPTSGVLVTNFVGRAELEGCALMGASTAAGWHAFASACGLTVAGSENVVAAFFAGDDSMTARALRSRVFGHPCMANFPAAARAKLRFRAQTLFAGGGSR